MFGLSSIKLYAYLAAFLLLAGVVAYGAHIVKKASRTDAAEAALAGEIKRHKADLAQVEKALAASTEERKKLQKGLTEIADRFNRQMPPPKTLVKYVQVPGETCPRASVSDSFVVRYNEASD